MTKRPLLTSIEGLVDAMLAPPESRSALLKERLPPAFAAQLTADPPTPLPGRFLAAAPLNTQSTDRLLKANLKGGSALIVHVVFARAVADGPKLQQAVDAWKQAITTQWLEKQPAEEQQRIIGILPLIIRFG